MDAVRAAKSILESETTVNTTPDMDVTPEEQLFKLFKRLGTKLSSKHAATLVGCRRSLAVRVRTEWLASLPPAPSVSEQRLALRSLFDRFGIELMGTEAARIVGCGASLAVEVKGQYIHAVDGKTFTMEQSQSRRQTAAVMLVHLCGFTPEQAAAAMRLTESCVITVMDRALEEDLAILCERFPVGVAFTAWVHGLHREQAEAA